MAEPSFDPVLERLLPDMSENPDEARELRELSESGIRSTKVSNLTAVYRALSSSTGRVFVPEDEIPIWMSALNDLRIVLGTRLDINDAERAEEVAAKAGDIADGIYADTELSEDDEVENQLMLVYIMITWWQDSLIDAVRFRRPRG